jgi:hypothetical protein
VTSHDVDGDHRTRLTRARADDVDDQATSSTSITTTVPG